MQIINWVKRRLKSRCAEDSAVANFTRVAKEQVLPLDYDRDARLKDLLTRDSDPPVAELTEIAKLLGQSDGEPKL